MKDLPVELTEAQIAAAEAQIVELSKRVDFYITEYSLEILAKKVKDEEFVVPEYQREFTWEHSRKTRFIESLLIGLPIPFLFFWEMPNGKLEIVDGSQRLRTIHEFIHQGLRLGPMEALTNLEGFSYLDLPESRRRKIGNRSVRGIVLNEHADEQTRFDMFERINTGSKIAEKAEVRRGALAGPFMKLIIKLSAAKLFADLAPIPRKTEDKREREELVTRFFAYGDGLAGYRDRPSEFLFKYVKRMNAELVANPQLSEQYEQSFMDMLDFVSGAFPNGFKKTKTATSTPRARFEAISIGVRRALEQKPDLVADPAKTGVWANSKEFSDVTGSDGANAVARLQGRINYVKDKLLG